MLYLYNVREVEIYPQAIVFSAEEGGNRHERVDTRGPFGSVGQVARVKPYGAPAGFECSTDVGGWIIAYHDVG